MASRQEQKRKLREERMQREQEEAVAAARRLRLMTIGGGALFIVIIAIVAVVIASSGGSSSSSKHGIGQTEGLGLQVSPGPWSPEYAHLQQRVKALGLPDPSDAIYHIHSHVALFVDGKRVTVPAQIGIDANKQYLTSLHTHDTSGVIHQEAVQQYPFTLGQFFDVWGVKFTKTQLGAYHPAKGLVLQTYVNGKLVPDGSAYKFKPHDNLVVGFGAPGSFPKKVNFTYPSGE